MTGGQPEPSGLACAAFSKALKEKRVKKAKFIGDAVRVSASSVGPYVHIAIRYHRSFPVESVAVKVDRVPDIIKALTEAAMKASKVQQRQESSDNEGGF